MKIWFTARECVGLPGLPPDKRQIDNYFRKDIAPQYRRWVANKKLYECHLCGLPLVSQIVLIKKFDFSRTFVAQQESHCPDYDSELLWNHVEKTSAKELGKAQLKCQIIFTLEKLIALGITKVRAFQLTALVYGYNPASIQHWYYKTRHYQPVDYLPVLLNKYYKPVSTPD